MTFRALPAATQNPPHWGGYGVDKTSQAHRKRATSHPNGHNFGVTNRKAIWAFKVYIINSETTPVHLQAIQFILNLTLCAIAQEPCLFEVLCQHIGGFSFASNIAIHIT